LFNRFYELRKGQEKNRLTLTDINWCPFVQVVDGDIYDKNIKYYQDNGHYGLNEYSYVNDTQFKAAIVRGELYYKDETLAQKAKDINLTSYNKIKNLINDTAHFTSFDNDKVHAELSGIIYIDNTDEDKVDEYELSNVITQAYPQLKVFMSNVKEAYSAQFVVLNDDGSYNYVPDINGDDTY